MRLEYDRGRPESSGGGWTDVAHSS